MPLYVRDEDVNRLVEKLARMTGQNKTQVLKSALELAIDQLSRQTSLAQRVRPLQARARDLGIKADGQDDKALIDELSEGL